MQLEQGGQQCICRGCSGKHAGPGFCYTAHDMNCDIAGNIASRFSLPGEDGYSVFSDLMGQNVQAAKQAASAVKEAVPEAPQKAAKDAASAVKAAIPDQPKQAAQDAASSAKESLPDAPKSIPNPLQNFFGGAVCLAVMSHAQSSVACVFFTLPSCFVPIKTLLKHCH